MTVKSPHEEISIPELPVVITEDYLKELKRTLGQLFMAHVPNNQTPKERYYSALEIFEKVNIVIKERPNHPELLSLFKELDTSYQNAQERAKKFKEIRKID